MAGFKQTILSHEPKLFLTFDGDAFDPNTRKLTAIPETFLDESGYGSNILLHNEDPQYPAYRMGIPSLIDLEPTDQHSCSFGWYGYQPSATTRWPKAFIEVQHQQHLAFEENEGSFTVGFFVEKASNEDNWRNKEYELGFNHWTATLDKRFIRKAGSFDILYRDYWSSVEELRLTHPGGTFVWQVPQWFYKRRNFIVLTWSVTETDPDVFQNEARFYINGHIYGSYSNQTVATHPNSTSTSAIEVGGIINASSVFDDRQTSDLRLDQIFILNKALSHDEVCRLYRKARNYDNISLNALAQGYWPMTDPEDAGVFTIRDMVEYQDGEYQGGLTRIARQQPPPPTILGGSSAYFHNGGMGIVHRLSPSWGGYTPLFNLSDDWTFDLWVRFENTDRSVILSLQDDDYPHNGVLLEANRRNNIAQPGHIQFSISDEYQISSMLLQDNGEPYNFNDGRFHHVAMVRRGTSIYLWIDGRLHGSLLCPTRPVNFPGPGQMYLMGAAPGRLNTQGYLSGVAVYGYALDDAEIRMRNAYSLIYRIKGTVTLEGNPYKAQVRAFKSRTGELAEEVYSDTNSGDYLITLYDNSQIDLMVKNNQDPNIRYRVYGPITPAQYEDLP